MRIIAVIMGEPSSNIRNSEMSTLLDYAYNLYEKNTYITIDEILDTVEIEKGKETMVNIVPIEDVSVINKKGHKMGEISYEVSLNKITSPIKKGDIVGKLVIKEDNVVVANTNVTVEKNVDKASFFILYFRYLKDIISFNI